MSDRELLELAAKAAGIVVLGFFDDGSVKSRMHSATKWNPLTDDGDALRLAVELKLRIDTNTTFRGVFTNCAHAEPVKQEFHIGFLGKEYIEEPICQSDPSSAVRRVIVRAAAEIGRAMP